MTPNSDEYFTLHYSIQPERQRPPVVTPLPVPDGLVVCSALLTDTGTGGREFAHNGGRYYFHGFHFAEPTAQHPFAHNRYLIGEITADTTGNGTNPITVFDTFTHQIFVQKKGVFNRFNEAKEALQTGLTKPIRDAYNCNIFLE